MTCYCDLLTLDIWPRDRGSPFATFFFMATCWKATLERGPMRTWRSLCGLACANGRQTSRLIPTEAENEEDIVWQVMDSWTRIPEREMDWSKLSVMGGQEGSEEGLCIVYVWLGSLGHFKKNLKKACRLRKNILWQTSWPKSKLIADDNSITINCNDIIVPGVSPQ